MYVFPIVRKDYVLRLCTYHNSGLGMPACLFLMVSTGYVESTIVVDRQTELRIIQYLVVRLGTAEMGQGLRDVDCVIQDFPFSHNVRG